MTAVENDITRSNVGVFGVRREGNYIKDAIRRKAFSFYSPHPSLTCGIPPAAGRLSLFLAVFARVSVPGFTTGL